MKKFIRLGMASYIIQGAIAGNMLVGEHWFIGLSLAVSGLITALIVAELENI